MIEGSDGSECNLFEYYVLYFGETVPLSGLSMSEVRGPTLLPDYTVSCQKTVIIYVLIFCQVL
jgi:hypothetical protein